MERKKFLKNGLGMLGISAILIDACKKDVSGDTSASTTGSTNGSDCTVSPTEVEGPYPYPDGEANNPLNRSDVTEDQTGVALAITFLVVDVNNGCEPVSGARVDIWHCNKDGYYSGYANQTGILGTKSYVGDTFLRGYQATDSNGEAKFTTIYPGWYAGRATHIHMEVYVNSILKKTTQMAFSETINDTVYASSLYALHGSNTTSNSADSIFGDSATDLANETITLAGSVDAGYTGTFTIGIEL